MLIHLFTLCRWCIVDNIMTIKTRIGCSIRNVLFVSYLLITMLVIQLIDSKYCLLKISSFYVITQLLNIFMWYLIFRYNIMYKCVLETLLNPVVIWYTQLSQVVRTAVAVVVTRYHQTSIVQMGSILQFFFLFDTSCLFTTMPALLLLL